MDFYQRKATLTTNTRLFLTAKEKGSIRTWADFVRSQALELGVSEKLCLAALEIVEPRLTVEKGEIVKKGVE